MRRWVSLLALAVLIVFEGRAGYGLTGVELVKNINTTANAVAPAVEAGGIYYFVNGDPEYGLELWKSDGTASGTMLLKDINPGPAPSNVQNLTNLNGTLYFSALSGKELWKSDGTAAGTVKIVSGYFASSIIMTNIGGTLYLGGYDFDHGRELWKSDGTEAGSMLVKDIMPGYGAYITEIVDLNGTLFLSADDGTNGHELWKSDGTEEGTVLVKDIRPGSDSSRPCNLTNVNGTLFFSASDGMNGCELWKSDGTQAGTTMVKNIAAGSSSAAPNMLTLLNGVLYFGAYSGSSALKLWRSDGTAAGAYMVKDIGLGPYSTANPQSLAVFDGKLYFAASDSSHGTELWKSDGTAAGTVMIRDIFSGSSSSNPQSFVKIGGDIYFAADDGANGQELWKTDGSAAGTVRIKDIAPGSAGSNPQSLANVDGRLLFIVDDGTNGPRIWRSDGTDSGTVQVAGINPGSQGSGPLYFDGVDGTLYFSARDGIHGEELWKSDGTETGTLMVKDVQPGSGSGYRYPNGGLNGLEFFVADDGINGDELWRSDGTDTGTYMLKDITPIPWDYTNFGWYATLNNRLYFQVTHSELDGSYSWDLWETDGTESGTLQVLTTDVGSSYEYWRSFDSCGGRLYFQAADAANGAELWKSDGTATGTMLLKDINPGAGSSYPGGFTDVNGTLFFVASDGSPGYEVWKSDGTESGTMMVKDIYHGSAACSPWYLTNVDGMLYFTEFDETHGSELWKSDGTEDGTTLVKDIAPGPDSSGPWQLTAVNGMIYFIAHDETHGDELWKSDGTEQGTVLVKDIWPGPNSSDPSDLINLEGTLYFRATDGTNGPKLWRSDGTAEGTVIVGTIDAGSDYFNPNYISNFNGTLYFGASGVLDGSELWRLRVTPPTEPACPTAAAAAQDSITWAWADRSDDETGFKIYAGAGGAAPNVATSTSMPNSGIYTAASLVANTQYAFQVAATNATGDSAKTDVATTWTLIEPVAGLAFSSVSANAIGVSSTNIPSNLLAGASGLYFENLTQGTGGGWQQSNSPWNSTGLTPNTQYAFRARSRNGAGIETPAIEKSCWTLAATPATPAISSSTTNSLTVSIAPTDSNPAWTEYAIACPTTSQWVQADGTMAATPVWRSTVDWGATAVVGLNADTSYAFIARARNGGGLESADSPAAATMTSAIPATITAHPAGQTVNPMAAVGFDVSATGTAPIEYRWRKNGTPLSDSDRISGTGTARLRIDGARQTDEGAYDCLVSNPGGDRISQAATLMVNDPPTILAQPNSQTVDPGTTLHFSIATTGTMPLMLKWKRNGVDLSDGGRIGGASSATLSVSSARAEDAGWYTCTVSNTVDEMESAAARLTVNPVLQVISDFGDPVPSLGDHIYTTGSLVSASMPVTEVPDASGTTRRVCTGWTGEGAVAAEGTATTTTFVLNCDSTLTWQWKTRYCLAVAVDPVSSGTVTLDDRPTTAAGWYDAGQTVTLKAVAGPGCVFTQWSGDATEDANPVPILMDRPKTILAHFARKNGVAVWLLYE